MKPYRSVAIALSAVVFVQGCATIVTGTSQPPTIETEPPGATCSVARKNEKLAAIATTPDQVTVSRGFGALSVNCSKEQFSDATESVPGQMEPWFIGNIVLLSTLGVIIDLLSGAIMRYDRFVTLALFPTSFKSPEERDGFVSKRRAAIDAWAVKAQADAERACGSNACDASLRRVADEKSRRLAELDTKVAAIAIAAN